MLHQVALVALFCVQTLANPGCGVPRSKHQALIVRGSPTQPGEWPWHAGVYHRSGRNSQYACGGTLISAEFVVTAAHCMLDEGTSYRLTRKRLFVRLGVHNLDRIDPGAMQQFTIADIHMFGNFSRDNLHNDIALLELGEMVRMTDYVVPACVNRNVNLDGLAGTAVGWGVTEDDEISLELKQVTLPVIDSVDCLESDRDLFGTMMHKGMFCAGYQNGSSVCNGDSGGGMFFNRDGMWYLGGIVSFQKFRKHGTNLCYTRGYAAFTNVAKYLDWMGNITGMDFSERPAVLVTTTEAPKKRERVPCSPRVSDKISIKAEFYNGQYDFRLDGLKMVLHPNHTGTDYVSTSAVVLIDLGRNYDELKPDVGCLWTDPNEITLESVGAAIWPTEMPTGPPLNVSESADGRFLRTNDNISCDNDRSILGVRLGLRKKGESFFRLVGPLVDCDSSEYARLTPEYLDWIESVVWPGETVNANRNRIVNLSRKPFSK
ncbi:hypothetical protein quinque_005033 [Culex quinquefasciatus]